MSSPAPARSPAADHDRRAAPRHAVRMVGHVQGPGIASMAVSLTDFSEAGCQIARSDWLGDAELVTLTLDGFAAFACRVAWTSHDATGLQFDERLHPAVVRQIVRMGQGLKRAKGLLDAALVRRDEGDRRWRVAQDVSLLPARKARRTTPIAARLFDLSSAGCRIITATRLSPGTELVVTINGLDPLPALVCWSDTGGAGLSFVQPADPQAIERVATAGLSHLPRIAGAGDETAH